MKRMTLRSMVAFLGLMTTLGCAPKEVSHSSSPDTVFYRGNYFTLYDVAYGEHERQVMDIHLRGRWADSDDRLNLRLEGPQPPTVVFAHGSAWYISDKREWEHFISPFLQAGYNVVNLNYRLREGIAPALEDVRGALFHLSEKNESYALDLENVFLAGTSAGGFMALFHGAAQNAVDATSRLPKDLNVAGVVNIVGGGTDCFEIYEQLVNHEKEFWQKVGQSLVDDHEQAEEEMAKVCPSQHFSEGDPPVFLAHGERDEFGSPEKYRRVEEALLAHGIPVERVAYPNSGHTFIQEDWQDLFPRILNFIERHSGS